MLSPPILNSEQLHIVERFSLAPETMLLTRSYTSEDPVYFKGQFTGWTKYHARTKYRARTKYHAPSTKD